MIFLCRNCGSQKKKREQIASDSEKAREFSYLKLPERRTREHHTLLISLNNSYILAQKSEGVSSLCGQCVKVEALFIFK